MISAKLIPFTLMLSGLLAALPLSEAHPRQVLPLTDSHQALPLFGMGGNTVGQLGDGTADNHNIPILIAGAAVYAAGGNTHSMFVRSDGSLWAMGSNYNGQLGDGTTDTRFAPVEITAGVTQASAGFGHSVFVKQDSGFWSSGLLADESHPDPAPVQITGDVVQTASGMAHSLFIKTDGSLWGMG